jgi:ribA/ribD-fused uncharacterized protein
MSTTPISEQAGYAELRPHTRAVLDVAQAAGLRPRLTPAHRSVITVSLNEHGPDGYYGAIEIGATTGRILRCTLTTSGTGPTKTEGARRTATTIRTVAAIAAGPRPDPNRPPGAPPRVRRGQHSAPRRLAMATPIVAFEGDHRFLSTYWYVTVEYDGIRYGTVAHAILAAKSTDLTYRRMIRDQPSPARATQIARPVRLRRDWSLIRDRVMLDLTRQKFVPGTPLAARLLDTGDVELVDGNQRNDRYWGVVDGEGRNTLGRILMQVRAELAGRPARGLVSVGSAASTGRN